MAARSWKEGPSDLEGILAFFEDRCIVHEQGMVLQVRMLLLQGLHACAS